MANGKPDVPPWTLCLGMKLSSYQNYASFNWRRQFAHSRIEHKQGVLHGLWVTRGPLTVRHAVQNKSFKGMKGLIHHCVRSTNLARSNDKQKLAIAFASDHLTSNKADKLSWAGQPTHTCTARRHSMQQETPTNLHMQNASSLPVARIWALFGHGTMSMVEHQQPPASISSNEAVPNPCAAPARRRLGLPKLLL